MENDTKSQNEEGNYIIRFLRKNKNWRNAALITSLISVILGIMAYGAIWYWVIPVVWRWGFDPISRNAILSVLGLLFLIFLPVGLIFSLFSVPIDIIKLYLEEQESELSKKIDKMKDAQSEVEEELKAIEKNDPIGLTQLIRYSRLQLEAYYTIGLSQTQRSFRYSVIAMWIGFIILLGGIIQHVIPMEKLNLKPPSSDVNVLILVGGAIIEIISALFLWVYRSTIGQLTYFYNRQMHTHNVLLGYRIATTMQNSDDTKKVIVEKILDQMWTPERIAPQGAEGISKLLVRKT